MLINQDGLTHAEPDTLTAEGLVLQLQKAEGNDVVLGVKESDAVLRYVTLKAYKFPYIAILWIGTVIMIVGFFISMARRIAANRGGKPKGTPARERTPVSEETVV
jgi:cytochrome c-type biogenesis protein CcmF